MRVPAEVGDFVISARQNPDGKNRGEPTHLFWLERVESVDSGGGIKQLRRYPLGDLLDFPTHGRCFLLKNLPGDMTLIAEEWQKQNEETLPDRLRAGAATRVALILGLNPDELQAQALGLG